MSPPAKTLTIGAALLACVPVAGVSLTGVGRVGRRAPFSTASPVDGLAMTPFVGVCRSFPLCSDMSADAADHGSASRGVGVAVFDMAVEYGGRCYWSVVARGTVLDVVR